MNPTDKPKRTFRRKRRWGKPANVFGPGAVLAANIERLKKAEAKKAEAPTLPFGGANPKE